MQNLIRYSSGHLRFASSLTSAVTSSTPAISSSSSDRSVQVKPAPEPEQVPVPLPHIPPPRHPLTRPIITRMDPSSYANCAIGVQKPSLLERRGEANLILQHLAPDGKRKTTEWLLLIQQDIDLRPKNIKRVWRSIHAEAELREQIYNPSRNKILGRDLSAAHFLVARGGKVRFQNHTNWIESYRKDTITSPGSETEDLPKMTRELCTMPTSYDPSYRIEEIDASGVRLWYEGLGNFEHLNHVTSLQIRQSPFLNDWCLDRVIGTFSHTLEHLDLSGCQGISDRGLAAMWRLRSLKTLILRDLPQIENLEIVCAHLEDKLPGLQCIGIEYEDKIEEVREKLVAMEEEGRRFERGLIEQEGSGRVLGP